MPKAVKKPKSPRYTDATNGFSVLRPPSAFSFEGTKEKVKPGGQALLAKSKQGDHQLVVLIAPAAPPDNQRSMALRLATEVIAPLGGRCMAMKPLVRPDRRPSFQVPYLSKKQMGAVVTIGGLRRTYVAVSGFPSGDQSAAAADLLLMQLSIMIKE